MKTPMATARLSFDYAGYTVTHATEATLIVHKVEAGMIQFQRNLVAEERAFARMIDLGLMPVHAFPEAKVKAAQAWDFSVQIGAVPAHFADLLQHQVPQLQVEGWRIAYDKNWSLSFFELEADSLTFDVEPSGIDWFDISLGARIDGKPIDILPLLRRMLSEHGADLLDLSLIHI